ncbi:MAG TPA: DUF1330 domain-containing protein [Polyangiaceae bacterium]|jgi:uncharacterized protein (DUF1330 family)|nr:DUF1330 domain-containing protein [Polyangiaceae bacterium]
MIEILVGLRVTDEATYATYRTHMTPLLIAHGGSFGVDLRVGEILKNPGPEPFNRLFTIRFPSLAEHDAFFADPDYVKVRERYFEPSVAYRLGLGRYEVLA